MNQAKPSTIKSREGRHVNTASTTPSYGNSLKLLLENRGRRERERQ